MFNDKTSSALNREMSVILIIEHSLLKFNKMKIGLIEFALIEAVVCMLLWLIDEYTASLLCVIVPFIALAVLIIARIAEFIEASKVPKIFFGALLVTVIVPIVSFGVYFAIFGSLGWMSNF